LVTEADSPTGEEPLEWLLLTTLSIETFQQAAQCVLWYRFRWLIERYHFVLKSGCHLEKLQLETAERLERALALYCIVAWRLLHLTYLARATPDASCEVVFQIHEWQAFTLLRIRRTYFHYTAFLHEATRLVAKLGGFLARKSDGEPGVQPSGAVYAAWMTYLPCGSSFTLLPLKQHSRVVGNDKLIAQVRRERWKVSFGG